PSLDDLILLCQKLNEDNVKYVVLGGFAVNYHGLNRGTTDIDILVDTSEKNITRIKKAMSYLPIKAIEDVAPGDVEKYNVVRVADEIVIDLMAKACEVTYKTAGIEYYEFKGVNIPIVTLSTLIKTKEHSLRTQDKEDLIFLRLVESENMKDKQKGKEL
ncbi:MAG: hypothetical protein U9O97_02515, partial [Elusimicrobiota bacterium]|nr:hypothetical protein [Elusimicrobiota bacterium]